MKVRTLHRKASLIFFIPLMIVVLTGIVLQLRNQFEWLQPKTVTGASISGEVLGYKEIITVLDLKENEVEQVIYRPKKKNISVRLAGGEEIQIDHVTGEVLKRAIRRTGFLIDLHQGSILGPFGQYGIFFLSGLGLLFLLITGALLLFPKRKRYV